MGLFSKKDKDKNLKTLMKHYQGLPGIRKACPLQLIFDAENEKLVIMEYAVKNGKEFQLSFSKITSVGRTTEEIIKKANGVGRAIVGGLLFSGVGAIVGATTARDKTETVYYRVINYISDGEEKSIVLDSGNDIKEIKFFAQMEKTFNGSNETANVTEL